MRNKTSSNISSPSFLMVLAMCLFFAKTASSQHCGSIAAHPNIAFLSEYLYCFIADSNIMKNVSFATAIDSKLVGPVLFFNNSTTYDSSNSASKIDSLLQQGALVIDEDTVKANLNENGFDTMALAYLYAMYDAESERMVNKYAEMVETEPEEIKNLPLYRFIDHWYGVRYKYGGMTRKGIDCSAFSQRLYGNVYCVNLKRTSKQQFKKCERLEDVSEAEEGDLVFFKINRVRISHVGVYLANGYFVHATRSKGIMISSLNNKYWQRRYAGCGRVHKPYTYIAESDYID